MRASDFITEVTRRDALKTMGVAAGAAALPPQTLARAFTPTTVAGTPAGGWIWTRLGDRVDQRYLTDLVARILKKYRLIANINRLDIPDETAIKTKLNQVLRKHIPKMGPTKHEKFVYPKWYALWKDLTDIFPMPALPEDLPDVGADPGEWDDYFDRNPGVDEETAMQMARDNDLRWELTHQLRSLGNVARDANLGDTENYGYKVNHRIKTGKIRPVDYSQAGSSVAQAAQTVAAQAPRGAIASTLGTAGAALRDLGSRARDYVTKQGIKTLAPKALAAPTTDTEFMRDLQNRIQEPRADKAKEPDGLAENRARRRPLVTYLVRLRLPQSGYNTIMDTTVQARTAEMARRMVRAQYGARSVLVGQPRRVSAK